MSRVTKAYYAIISTIMLVLLGIVWMPIALEGQVPRKPILPDPAKFYKVEFRIPGSDFVRNWKSQGAVVTNNNGASWTFVAAGTGAKVSVSGGVLIVTEVQE